MRLVGLVLFALIIIKPCKAQNVSLTLSTLIGGSQFDHARDVAVDSEGNIYVTGGTASPDFPTTPGAYQRIHNPGTPESSAIQPMDIFVMKFDPGGNLLWSTLIGGPNYERAYAIEVDAKGYVYVAGRAGRGAPTTAGAFQTTLMGGSETAFYGPQDGYVAKLSPDGGSLVWASYFGGTDPSIVRDIAVDSNGNVYLASMNSAGSNYPSAVSRAFFNSPIGGGDGVIAKISADGGTVLWARFLGGSGSETGSGPAVRLDGAGNVYYLGLTGSTDAYTTSNAYSRSLHGNRDYYLVKLAPDGQVAFATYLGGSGNEGNETHNLAVDIVGNSYVGGSTCSADFPTTADAFSTTFNGRGGSGTGGNSNYPCDGQISKISPDGSRLLGSTYFGGQWGDAIEGIDVDARGEVHVTGATFSPNLPISSGAHQRTLAGSKDGFYARFSSDLSRLIYSSYLGGQGNEAGRAIVAGARSVYIAGEAEGTGASFPSVNAFQSLYGGVADAILAVFTPIQSPRISTGGVVGAGLSVPPVRQASVGALITVRGEGFTPSGIARSIGSADLVGGRLPTKLEGVCVHMAGRPAPLVYVSETQINLQVPDVAANGSVPLQVITGCGENGEQRTQPEPVMVQPASPEFFFFQLSLTGKNAIAAIDAVTGTFIGAPDLLPGASSTPARPGQVVALYMTGLGATVPFFEPGLLVPQTAATGLPVRVRVGNIDLPDSDILYAGLSPSYAGLYQINLRIGDAVADGDQPIMVQVGDYTTPPGGYLTIQRASP